MSAVETLANTDERGAAGDEELLTIAETCDLLRLGRTTVWRLMRDGELTGFRIGGGNGPVRILASSVEGLLRRGRIEPMAPAGPRPYRRPWYFENRRRRAADDSPDSEELT